MKMKFISFESKAFYKLIDEITNKVVQRIEPLQGTNQKEWVSANEAKELLCIKSTGKLNTLVKNGHILASQHGRTIVYSKKSIDEFLKKGIINNTKTKQI